MSTVTVNQPPPATTPVLDERNEKVFSFPWSGWFRNIYNVLRPGITVTITTAKLTPGGANGSMTFTNGILTGQTAAT